MAKLLQAGNRRHRGLPAGTLQRRAIGKMLLAGAPQWQRYCWPGAPQKTVGSGHGNKRQQGKQPAGREHHREAGKERARAVGKEIAPAASRERAPRAASKKKERQKPLSCVLQEFARGGLHNCYCALWNFYCDAAAVAHLVWLLFGYGDRFYGNKGILHCVKIIHI